MENPKATAKEMVLTTLMVNLTGAWRQTIDRLTKQANESPDEKGRAFYLGASERLTICANEVLDALNKASKATLADLGIELPPEERKKGDRK